MRIDFWGISNVAGTASLAAVMQAIFLTVAMLRDVVAASLMSFAFELARPVVGSAYTARSWVIVLACCDAGLWSRNGDFSDVLGIFLTSKDVHEA
jgi:hypothetical protein